MEPKRHLKMKKMPPETHFEKDTVPKGPRDRFFLVFAAPEPLKMCLWPRRRAIFHIFTHFTFFTENEPKSHQSHPFWEPKCIKSVNEKQTKNILIFNNFVSPFWLHFGSPGGPWGLHLASKMSPLDPLGAPFRPPLAPRPPQAPPKPQFLTILVELESIFLPFWRQFASILRHAFMLLCLYAFMPLCL